MHDFNARTPLLLALLTVSGCVQRSDAGSTGEAKSGTAGPTGPAETRLVLDVPSGLAIAVDGEPRGNTSPEPLVVSSGKHTVEVDSPCGKASATVEAAAGALTTVSAQEFAGLKVAQLTVIARTPERKPANQTVFLGDWEVPGAAAEPTAIPACKLRLRVVPPEGLGGFVEDIEFEAGKSYVRELSLAPGPDMVRIAGGHFRIGPPGPDHYNPNFQTEVGNLEHIEGWPEIKTYEVDVETFDIDRTEVTAEQYHACYKAGFCGNEPVLSGSTRLPSKAYRHLCNLEFSQGLHTPKPGRENHPANCVAGWEAKKYCDWVGKRLPTAVEWEFAARSRNPEYACSWGGRLDRKLVCDRFGFFQGRDTKSVCSFPDDNTEQGLCDMMSNVGELATHVGVSGRDDESDCPDNVVIRGSGWDDAWFPPFLPRGCEKRSQSYERGFRCARAVNAVPPQG
ncbi:formylglycine-generating enzyme family protein [Nannocystis pusilla]|uniref:Formylglycine-generating enzyme family protein n=1 Tax=Nannocystis pusilla TaxID=889268 RepID=A0ABS7TM19_9BACT|nr:SUMF1/EgtB/PvdO family nonheme iron enzyme [Nannocystis pusilla]MBZ5709255.1 formylglycine-generating enzyme family protein [Nannocystis pusilla]